MKCYYCGKEESNSDIKISVEQLIWSAQEYFDDYKSYASESKRMQPYWERTEKEQTHIAHLERSQYSSQNALWTLGKVLNLDMSKLYAIARLARKWEQKRKWEYSFPSQYNAKRILEWLTSKEGNNSIDNIHREINYKAAKQKAA